MASVRQHHLAADDFDLSWKGIAHEDADALLREAEQVGGCAVKAGNDIPEPPVTPVSVAGEPWLPGSRRLISGDSNSADAVSRLRVIFASC